MQLTDAMFGIIGSGCFGLVIGCIAWHVFSSGKSVLNVTTLAAFVGALAGAVVFRTFPAGTNFFAAYACGLALGFFLRPVSDRITWLLSSIFAQPALVIKEEQGSFPEQLGYLSGNWNEVESVIVSELDRNNGVISQSRLLCLPLDNSGRTAALKMFARKHPKEVVAEERFFLD
jgi:hypothetical protein